MEFLGIGPYELFFVILIALIILGPKDMRKAGLTLGRFLRKTVFSPTWQMVNRRIRALPYEMMREAGIEEEDLKVEVGDLGTFPTTAPARSYKLPQANPPASEGEPGIPSEWTTPQSSQMPDEWLPKPPTAAPDEDRTIQPPRTDSE